MSPTEYDADIFFLKKNHIFLVSRIPASKFPSLKHICCFFRTHLWNTAATSFEHYRHIFGTQRAVRVERSLIRTLWPFLLQHCDRSNLMMRPEYLRTPFKFIIYQVSFCCELKSGLQVCPKTCRYLVYIWL